MLPPTFFGVGEVKINRIFYCVGEGGGLWNFSVLYCLTWIFERWDCRFCLDRSAAVARPVKQTSAITVYRILHCLEMYIKIAGYIYVHYYKLIQSTYLRKATWTALAEGSILWMTGLKRYIYHLPFVQHTIILLWCFSPLFLETALWKQHSLVHFLSLLKCKNWLYSC